MTKTYNGFKDLIVYKKSFELSKMIFDLTLNFPKNEMYSLTDQIRRSSRSIAANIAESWPKRIYIKSFIAKCVDSQSESCETTYWLDQAFSLNYISEEDHEKLDGMNNEIQKMLSSMIKNADKFCHNSISSR